MRQRRRFVRQRVPVVQRVTFKYTYNTPVTALVADLSEGAAFILTPNPVPAGTVLNYKLLLPSDPEPIKGHARVVRTSRRGPDAQGRWATGKEKGLGMAVEFQNLNQEDQDRIKFFVASVLFKVPPGS